LEFGKSFDYMVSCLFVSVLWSKGITVEMGFFLEIGNFFLEIGKTVPNLASVTSPSDYI
jgi:hypothetical protein